MRHRFDAEQWVPYSRKQVFAFFANPANLPRLMPAHQHTRIEKMELSAPDANEGTTSPTAVAGEGSRIFISFRPVPLLPFRLAWEAHIVAFVWNEFFCDEQERGPFRYFRHCHRLRDERRAQAQGCVVSDAVEYELPFGVLGNLANEWLVKRQIRSLFALRQRRLLELLGESRSSEN